MNTHSYHMKTADNSIEVIIETYDHEDEIMLAMIVADMFRVVIKVGKYIVEPGFEYYTISGIRGSISISDSARRDIMKNLVSIRFE